MGVKHVEAFNDSLFLVQHVVGIYQCFDGTLNAYLDNCLKIIAIFNDFIIHHVSLDENTASNDLAKQASGFRSNRRIFYVLKKLNVLVFQTEWSSFLPMQSVKIYSVEPSSAKSDGLV
jgi:hypothetical protein